MRLNAGFGSENRKTVLTPIRICHKRGISEHVAFLDNGESHGRAACGASLLRSLPSDGRPMPSAIDPTRPPDNIPASKADLRANLAAAKAEIEALQSANIKSEIGTLISVDAAYVGALYSSVLVLCSSDSSVTVTLENDVPVGTVASLRQGGAGTVTAQAGSGATIQKPASADHYTAEPYDRITYQVVTNADGSSAIWGLV